MMERPDFIEYAKKSATVKVKIGQSTKYYRKHFEDTLKIQKIISYNKYRIKNFYNFFRVELE